MVNVEWSEGDRVLSKVFLMAMGIVLMIIGIVRRFRQRFVGEFINNRSNKWFRCTVIELYYTYARYFG